jgi:hypothetical protein
MLRASFNVTLQHNDTTPQCGGEDVCVCIYIYIHIYIYIYTHTHHLSYASLHCIYTSLCFSSCMICMRTFSSYSWHGGNVIMSWRTYVYTHTRLPRCHDTKPDVCVCIYVKVNVRIIASWRCIMISILRNMCVCVCVCAMINARIICVHATMHVMMVQSYNTRMLLYISLYHVIHAATAR